MSEPETGYAEFEILTSAETTAKCWDKCQKYTAHDGFITASDFTVNHLPLDCRDDSVHGCIQLMSDLTVRLNIRRPGSPSPHVDSSHEVKDAPSVTRLCTGYFSHFTIRKWASPFERTVIWKQRSTLDDAQTADSEEFSDSVDEFDLNRIKEQIVSEKDSEEMKEFVRHFGPESLRYLCLLVWSAVKGFKDRIAEFFRVLTLCIKFCYENGPGELDVTTLCLQDIIDHFAISSDMFTDDGASCHDPASTSDDATTNISDDTTPNISDDTTPNMSHDPTTNISDDTTSNISYTKADLTCVYPCPCPECRSIPNPQPVGYKFRVLTDRRAVLNNEEAANTVVDLEFEDEIKHLYGQKVQRVSALCDLQYLKCVTHEVKVAEWIKDKCAAFKNVYRQVCRKVSRPLAVICSYPHGHRKMISVGEWTARFSHDCGQPAPLRYVSYEYTTPTCPGSTGAPVLILGQLENYRIVYNEVQPHYGTLSLGGNKSGIGLALRY